MRFLKKIKWLTAASSVLLIVLGVVCIANAAWVQSVICYVAGAAMMVFGIGKIIRYFAVRSPLVDSLAVGTLIALIGFVLIVRADTVIELIFAFVGILLLLDGVVKLKNSFDARVAGMRDWIALLAVAVIVIAFGVLVIADPFGGASVSVIILGVSLIADGLQNLYTVFRAAWWAEKTIGALKKADPTVEVVDFTVDGE